MTRRRQQSGAVFLFIGAWLAGLCAFAQPKPLPLQDIDVVENLGATLPRGLHFTDSFGADVQLDSLLRSPRPVVLSLVYYRCPTLCGLVLSGLVSALRDSGMKLGEDYGLVTVSIDPTEGPELAREKRRGHLQALGYPDTASGWSFLTGAPSAIAALAHSVGFRYAYDDALKLYAHAAVLVVLSPGGKVSRYLYGVRYPPRDLRLALVEAAGGRVGTAFDRFLLTCYRYNSARRRYEPWIRGFLQVGGLSVFAALAAMLAVFWRRELGPGR